MGSGNSKSRLLRKHLVGLLAVCCLSALAEGAGAQATAPNVAPVEPATGPVSPGPATPTPPPVTAPAPTNSAPSTATSAPPSVVVQTGAPQPQSQNLSSPLPSAPAPSPSTAVIKVGGGMILLYSNNYAPKRDQSGGDKKHSFDTWRASIVLDAKLDRYAMHIEFRARDRPLRWMPVNSWFEELYASVDLLKPTHAWGPLSLKVGKSFMQFGRFWDNSFYGNIHLRDGLKLDPNWGLSLEGAVGTGKKLGAKYFAQYYIVDGQTNTSNANRDTISVTQPGTTDKPIGARRRDRFILRVEPSYTVSPTMKFTVAGSFERFRADFPDTMSAANMAAMSRIKDLDNTESVMRYGADLSAQVLWFGAWAEWTRQDGRHTNAFPIAPRPAMPATAARPAIAERAGSSSDDITYYLAGGNVTYDRYTLQYNYNRAEYKNIVALDAGNVKATHKEWIHNPALSVKINDQLRFLLEFPIWRRKPIPGLTTIDPTKPALGTGKEEVIEQQVLATLHGKF